MLETSVLGLGQDLDDSSRKDKSGWINGEHTDLNPADETEDELEPAEESMHELKPAEVRVDELDELSELSDTILELNELYDTKDGDGLVAGRNGPFSAQRKIHNKFNLDDSSTKNKPGWINGEHTDLKPADETEDELEPAEESMQDLKPAEVRVDELDELSELSDTILELNELNDTEDGDGLVAGRNGPFSAQRKIHNKFNLGQFYTKFDQTFSQSISSPFSSRIP
ncbi:hypothetical protein F2Q69_00052918 [Brassica cretica]|uniref:Uncharacterized protein n=1 Tax=Brassica cretica TaxID=69181 RepID=A0A8S9MXK3_BRACR|nr:hypothetical protein F2Q69_00052918 [Brassica cretica]